MRISDWSSDVCSSDLRAARACDDSRLRRHRPFRSAPEIDDEAALRRPVGKDKGSSTMISASIGLILGCLIGVGCRWFDLPLPAPPRVVGALLVVAMTRSEEHTSELQSLMRISYAVFCL